MGFAGILGVDAFADKATAANEIVNLPVTIHAGDTLWSIASNYAEDGSDIRAYVREIAALNELDGNTIYAGHTILVPVIRG
jgi:LysM repeat protein